METHRKPKTFVDEVAAIPGGEGIRICMQCGNCTASCPAADKMDYAPTYLIAMIRAGLRDEVLDSNTPWHCLSCYTCTVRCPRGVEITELMHALERLATKENKASRTSKTPAMYRSFNECVYKLGKIPEFGMMMRYYLRTNPISAIGATPVALGLLSHGRLSLGNPKLSGKAKQQVKAILDKAVSLGGY